MDPGRFERCVLAAVMHILEPGNEVTKLLVTKLCRSSQALKRFNIHWRASTSYCVPNSRIHNVIQVYHDDAMLSDIMASHLLQGS